MTRTSTFTSYINVEPAKGVEQTFAKLEAQARASFGRIARQAGTASSSVTGLVGGRGSAGIGGATTTAMRAQASTMRELARDNARLAQETGRTNKHLNEQSHAASRARKEMGAFERTLRTTATTLNVVQGPLGPVAGRISAMANAVSELTGFRLGLAGTGAALFALVSQANKYTEVRSKLVPLFEAQEDVNRAMKENIRIAEASRTALAPVIDLYSRLTLAGRDVGLSQQRIERLTEIASKAAKLSGGTAVSQESGLYQFAQGVGAGNLQGDELRSVREGTLRLAKAIADGLGVPIAKLKELGKEGKLTPQVIADALEKESARIDAELARLPKTLASSAQEFQNALMTMVGGTDQALGFTTALAETLSLVAKNLNAVAMAAIGLGAAFAGARIEGYTRNLIQQAAETRKLRIEQEAQRKQILETSRTERQTSAQRITSLRQERQALRQRLAEDRAARAQALQDARVQLSESRRLGTGFENPRASIAYTQAVDRARIANQNYAASKSRLSAISGQLAQQTTTLTAATGRYRSATTAAATGVRGLIGRVGGLIASLNPLGILLGLGVTLLIEWAFRQRDAARAADEMASREAALSNVIDMTTGKLRTQNAELIRNAQLKARENYLKGAGEFTSAQKGLRSSGSLLPSASGRGFIASSASPEEAILNRLSRSEITISKAREEIGALRGRVGESGRQGALSRLDDFERVTEGFRRAGALDRVVNNRATSKDNELLGFSDYKPGAPVGSGDGVGKATKGRKDLAGASDQAAKAEKALEEALARTEKRQSIMDRYDNEPKALDRAAQDARNLQKLVGETLNGVKEIGKDNPLGKGIYTQEMANADKARIDAGVRKPLQDALRDQSRQLDISRLMLQGYEEEAAALEKALQLQDDIGEISREEYEQLLANERAQRRINDAMESRQRIASEIIGAVQQTRDSFEDMLLNLPRRGFSAIKDFGKGILDNMARIEARKLTEKLFAGADEKVRDLLKGQNGVESAVGILEKNSSRAASGADKLASATENAAARINAAVSGLPGTVVTGDVGVPGQQGTAAARSQVSSIATSVTKKLGVVGSVVSAIAGSGLSSITSAARNAPANDNSQSGTYDGEEIVVTAGKITRPKSEAPLPTAAKTFDAIGEQFGSALDGVFKTDGFFKKIGGSVGQAFQGAGTGMMASSFARALGIKQSRTGAAIGGAIGSFLPIPGGSIIGGLIGGTIGGMFKKTKSGSATIGGANGGLDVTGTGGNTASYKKEAEGLAGTVVNQITDIARALDADVNDTLGLSIGKRNKKFTLDPTGKGRTKGSGVLKFDTEEEAVEAAVRNLISNGVFKGISAASQKLLSSGKDIQRQLEKALLIESIPKRLMQRTDPVRFAVMELNRQFEQMIDALKEGGATAEQFADAQKLYELERADAIEAATKQASAAIQQFLDEMTGGSSSPLNKSTVYNNAASKLTGFRADIAAGKVVDQNELLTAARNFQDASRSLYGSSQSFFNDFNDLFALLSKARDNAGIGGNVTNLPASPFASDSAVQTALTALNNTTSNQTAELAGRLDRLIELFGNGAANFGNLGYGGGGALGLLPGFNALR